MATTAPRITDSAALLRRLAGLRRRGRAVALLRGAGWLVAVVPGGVVLAGLLDWRLHLPDLARAGLLVATLAAGGYVLVRHLLGPLTTPDDDLSLALRLEEASPGLNDALASA